MKLYEVFNGYTGFGAVSCIVVAKDEERAKELASGWFKKEALDCNGEKYLYSESFWTNLKTECLSEDTSNESVSEGGG